MTRPVRRAAMVGGVAGPAAFIVTWAVLGERAAGYSPVEDPISRLAAVDASTRWGMTAGILALAAGLGAVGLGLRDDGRHRAALAAAVTAAATVGIAATPLDGPLGGAPHAAAAGLAYASLATLPVLADGGRLALGASVVTGACLATSIAVDGRTGFWQRLGLTAGHLWVIGHALRTRRRHHR
jgi:hypothetical protein